MIATLPFGRTGHRSARTLFGAAALGEVSQADADRTLEVLLRYGINHIDVAASYGHAEERVGPWMDRYRNDFFLASKTGERSKQAATEEIHRSLERLRTDHLDLIQLHNLVDPIEWDQAMGPGGALEACVVAQEQGLVRAIGVTGHGIPIAGMHMRSLQRFDFDSVLLPYSWVVMQNDHYVTNFDQLKTLCAERTTAVQTIKSIAVRPWGERDHSRATWYEPLEDQQDIDWAVWWVLSNPNVFLNTAGDIHLLPKVLDAASRFDESISQQELGLRLQKLEAVPLFV